MARIIGGITIIILVVLGGIWFFNRDTTTPPQTPNDQVDSTPSGTWLNACTSEPQEQVTQLVETGQPVENGWMFLDKNENEVAADDLWQIDIPQGVYGQVFIPGSGLTYEVRGPSRIRVGAATFWCNDQDDQPNHGNMRLVNAESMPDPVGQWVVINLP